MSIPTIEEVIRFTVEAIYSNTELAKELVLKGGQALRMVEKISSRFSTDLDFSVGEEIKEFENFFKVMGDTLSKRFVEEGYHLFDFKYSERPQITKQGFPNTWKGWQYTFKIIQAKKTKLPLEKKRTQSLRPLGALGSNITIDISEFEYCSSQQKIKIKNAELVAYSRPLLAIEKLRALCQQNKGYKYIQRSPKGRARDFYDIERLYTKAITDSGGDSFIKECNRVLLPCFEAKEVDTSLIEDIFTEEFIEAQRLDWPSVKDTVKNPQPFDYYVEICRQFTSKLIK